MEFRKYGKPSPSFKCFKQFTFFFQFLRDISTAISPIKKSEKPNDIFALFHKFFVGKKDTFIDLMSNMFMFTL